MRRNICYKNDRIFADRNDIQLNNYSSETAFYPSDYDWNIAFRCVVVQQKLDASRAFGKMEQI